MEIVLNDFEVLKRDEMEEVDGGCLTASAGIAICLFVIGVCIGIAYAYCS